MSDTLPGLGRKDVRIDERELSSRLAAIGSESHSHSTTATHPFSFDQTVSQAQSFVSKSFLDEIDLAEAETTSFSSVNKQQLLEDIAALVTGDYTASDRFPSHAKSEHDLLEEMMDSFDRFTARPMHHVRKSANTREPARDSPSLPTKLSAVEVNISSKAPLGERSSAAAAAAYPKGILVNAQPSSRPSPALPPSTSMPPSIAEAKEDQKTISSQQLPQTESKKSTPRLSSRNFVSKSAVNPVPSLLPPGGPSQAVRRAVPGQDFLIVNGQIVRASAGSVNGSSATLSPLAEKDEYIRNYCKKNIINPFKHKEGEGYLRTVTHNRRRWSHVFPAGET
jgi:hypothetical protein